MRQMIINSILPEKLIYLRGTLGSEFNNLGLALNMPLIFYTIVAKGLKLKVRTFGGLIPTFVKLTEKKLVGVGPFWTPSPTPSWIGLNLWIYNFEICIDKWSRIKWKVAKKFDGKNFRMIQKKLSHTDLIKKDLTCLYKIDAYEAAKLKIILLWYYNFLWNKAHVFLTNKAGNYIHMIIFIN